MKLTKEHGPVIEGLLQEGHSYRYIADQLGCNKETVGVFAKVNFPELRRAPEQAKRREPRPVASGAPDEVEMLRAEVKELRKAHRTTREERIEGERLLDEIRNITTAAEPAYEAPATAHGDGKSHVHVLMLSDLHVGEVVDPEAMNGLGEYNFEILQERMQNIHRALVSFQNARPYPIDELRIWNLGDLVGGKHHEELAETNEFGPIQQTWRTGVLLGKFIEPLVEAYPTIHITGIAGNHGRINRKPQSKRVFEAYDWLALQTSALWLRNYPTVHHNYPLSGMALDHVAGKTVLLGHGDGIKSTMPGVPWGGVTRRFNELRKTYSQIGHQLDYFALGHFHQANVVRGIFMNGSVKGPDEHILKSYGTADPPEQLLLTFCRETQRLTDVSFITP